MAGGTQDLSPEDMKKLKGELDESFNKLMKFTDRPRELGIPLANGRYFKFTPPMDFTEADLEMVYATLKLWAPSLIVSSATDKEGEPDEDEAG